MYWINSTYHRHKRLWEVRESGQHKKRDEDHWVRLTNAISTQSLRMMSVLKYYTKMGALSLTKWWTSKTRLFEISVIQYICWLALQVHAKQNNCLVLKRDFKYIVLFRIFIKISSFVVPDSSLHARLTIGWTEH